MSTHDGKGYGQDDPRLARWAAEVFAPSDPALREIIARSNAAGLPPIAVSAFDGLHLEVLVRAIAPRRVIEIGTLGGYSGLCILRGLPPDGELHTFELVPEHAEVARASYAIHGYAERAHVHVGPARERLRDVEPLGPVDIIFIDADKAGYPAYLDWAERHLRVGGVLLADNAFAFGRVADVDTKDEAALSLRAFNTRLAQSGIFRATMLPTGEGLAMGVKIREP